MSEKLKRIRNLIILFSEAGGLILWLFLPWNVPYHFTYFPTPDAWGSKFLVFALFVLPLIAFFPVVTIPELHSDSEESLEELEKAKIANARGQLAFAILECMIFWILLITITLISRR